jgi:hypothetical protein
MAKIDKSKDEMQQAQASKVWRQEVCCKSL